MCILMEIKKTLINDSINIFSASPVNKKANNTAIVKEYTKKTLNFFIWKKKWKYLY